MCGIRGSKFTQLSIDSISIPIIWIRVHKKVDKVEL